jgi:hypothetical protein
MRPIDASLLTTGAILVVILIAWLSRRGRDQFCSGAGPENIALYDWPQTNYPRVEGRWATRWDGDRACAAYCAQPPCVVWCR